MKCELSIRKFQENLQEKQKKNWKMEAPGIQSFFTPSQAINQKGKLKSQSKVQL